MRELGRIIYKIVMMKLTSEVQKEHYKPGEFIFFEGDIDYHFYIIEEGQVQIFTKHQDGQRIDIATMEPGESFGEFALLDRAPRSATAQALTETTLVKVSEKGYEHLLSELPVWASSMLKNFSGRLKKMNELIKGELDENTQSKILAQFVTPPARTPEEEELFGPYDKKD